MGAKFLAERVAVVTASTKVRGRDLDVVNLMNDAKKLYRLQGIGFAIAKRLGLDGASVVVSSRKEANVKSAVDALRTDGIRCEGTVAHVGVDSDRKHLIEFAIKSYGKLDILVSNAAANPHYGDLMSVSDSLWEKLLSLNVKSAYLLAKEAIPHLEKSGNSNIVFVTSVAGYNPIEGIGAYSVMKTALLGLNKSLSQSLARRHIRVNAIAPGIIRTDFSKALIDVMESSETVELNRIAPLGRFGEAEECAGAVSFLVSDEASYITGETVGVNGGMHARI